MKFAAIIALIVFASSAHAADCSLAEETQTVIAAAQAANLGSATANTSLTKKSHLSLKRTVNLLASHMPSEEQRLLMRGRILRLIRTSSPLQCSQSEDTPLCLAAALVKAKTKAGLCK